MVSVAMLQRLHEGDLIFVSYYRHYPDRDDLALWYPARFLSVRLEPSTPRNILAWVLTYRLVVNLGSGEGFSSLKVLYPPTDPKLSLFPRVKIAPSTAVRYGLSSCIKLEMRFVNDQH